MKKYIISGLIGLTLLTGFIFINSVKANITLDQPSQVQRFRNYDFFVGSTTAPTIDGTTSSATSTNMGIQPWFDSSGNLDNGYFPIAGAKQVTFYFGTTGTSTQSAVFNVQITPDGTNWYNYNKLVQNVASSTNPGLTLTSQSVASTTVTIDSMNLDYDTFFGVRCIAAITNAASSTCKASASF